MSLINYILDSFMNISYEINQSLSSFNNNEINILSEHYRKGDFHFETWLKIHLSKFIFCTYRKDFSPIPKVKYFKN